MPSLRQPGTRTPAVPRLLLALAAALALAGPALAGAPMVKTQAPGYYRMMLGEFEVTALSDGTVALPVDQLLTGITPKHVTQALARHNLKSPRSPPVI